MSNLPLAPAAAEPSVSIHPVVAALTAERKAQLITQAQLAERAGLSRMTVQRLESNGLDPRLSTLQEMAAVLDQELLVVPKALRARLDAWLAEQPAGPAA